MVILMSLIDHGVNIMQPSNLLKWGKFTSNMKFRFYLILLKTEQLINFFD